MKNYSGGAAAVAAVTQAAAPESSTCPSAGRVNFGPVREATWGQKCKVMLMLSSLQEYCDELRTKNFKKMPRDNDAAVSRSSFAALYN